MIEDVLDKSFSQITLFVKYLEAFLKNHAIIEVSYLFTVYPGYPNLKTHQKPNGHTCYKRHQ